MTSRSWHRATGSLIDLQTCAAPHSEVPAKAPPPTQYDTRPTELHISSVRVALLSCLVDPAGPGLRSAQRATQQNDCHGWDALFVAGPQLSCRCRGLLEDVTRYHGISSRYARMLSAAPCLAVYTQRCPGLLHCQDASSAVSDWSPIDGNRAFKVAWQLARKRRLLSASATPCKPARRLLSTDLGSFHRVECVERISAVCTAVERRATCGAKLHSCQSLPDTGQIRKPLPLCFAHAMLTSAHHWT